MEDADAGGLTIEMKNGNFTNEESNPDQKRSSDARKDSSVTDGPEEGRTVR